MSHALDVIDDRLATIGLTELNARAALQTRVDSKYMVGLDVLDALVERLRTDRELATDVLEVGGVCEQTYDTVYFDRPGLGCYADHLQRRRLSYKLRTRVYLGSELHVFEVKMRDGRGHTVKVKTDHRGERPDVIGPAAARFYRESIADRYGLDVDAEFAPSLRNRYTRITLAARHGQERTTIDHTLTFLDPTPTSPGPVKWPESVEERTRGGMNADLVLVETKSAHGAGRVDRALWSLGARPRKVSKYCIGIGIVHGLTDPTRRWPNRYLAAMRLGFSLELPVEVPTGRRGAAAPPISVEDLPKAPRPSRAKRPPRPVRPPR